MGQGLVSIGDLPGAYEQLKEIEALGGQDTWALAALAGALRGIDTSY